jgi:hypothetical protein
MAQRKPVVLTTNRKSYYVAVFQDEAHFRSWNWEIRRKKEPMGVRVKGNGFRSKKGAQLAGNQVLEDFLSGLSADLCR